jgi:hypothetical protein
MSREILTDYDFKGVSRLKNLPNAVEDTEPVTLAQLKAYQESTSVIDSSDAVEGSIPLYSVQSAKFIATALDTKQTIIDGGTF